MQFRHFGGRYIAVRRFCRQRDYEKLPVYFIHVSTFINRVINNAFDSVIS